MCFFYSITKKSANSLIKGKVVTEKQLELFEEHYIVNGYDHPNMPVITNEKPDEIQYFQWGLMPENISTLEQGKEFLNKYNTLNAKAENISESRLYSDSFFNRRCLVLCSGFFEWRKVKKEKIPYYITLKNNELFVFAGIWNKSTDKSGKSYNTYSILTVQANELMSEIHNEKNRMPLILSFENAKKWIDLNLKKSDLQELIKPISSDQLHAYPIKKFIPSNSKNLDNSEIIAYYNYPHVPVLLNNSNYSQD